MRVENFLCSMPCSLTGAQFIPIGGKITMAKTRIRLNGQVDNDLVDKSNSNSVSNGAALSGYGAGALDGHMLRADGKVALSTAIADIDAGDGKALITKEWSAAKLAAAESTLEGLIDDLEAVVNAADAALQGNIDAEAATRSAADSTATSDRAAIRSEFIAADAVIVGDAASAYNTLGKLEDKIQEEAAAARAAESVIQSDVDTNEADGDTDRALIRTEMATNETNRDASVEAIRLALQNDVDANEADSDAAEAALANDIGHLVTLSGVAVDSDHMGTFTGSTIADNQTVKQALQALETTHEADDAAMQSELDATQAGVGLAANGSYAAPANGANGFVTVAGADLKASLKAAVDSADASIKTEQDARVAADAAIQSELDVTQVGAGLAASGAYVAVGSRDFIANATSLDDADDKLDGALKAEETARISADSALSGRLDTVEAGLTAGVVWKASVANLAALDALVEANITDGWAYYVQATKDVYVKVATAGDYQPSGWATAGFLKIADFTEISGLVTAEATRATNAEAALQADINQNESDGDTDRALIRSEMATNETNRDASVEAIRLALQNDVDTNEADGDTDRALIRSEIAAAKLVDDAALATEAATRLAADNAATTDRALIRTEFAAADTALIGGASATHNTLKKIEDLLDAEIAATNTDFASAATDRALIRTEFAAADATLSARATFLEGRVVRENFTVASSNQNPAVFALANLAEHGSLMVYINGLLQDDGASDDYQMSESGGVSLVTFNSPGLITGDKVSVKYDKRL